MKKKPAESASVINVEESVIISEELLTAKADEEQSVQLPETESLLTSRNVIKTRH